MNGSTSRRLRRALFWTTGVAIVTLAAATTNPILLAAALPVWAVSWRRVARPEAMQASRATLGALALALFSLLMIGLTQNPRDFIELFSLALGGLILIKLFDRQTARDQALLLCMSTSLVIGAALLYSTLVIGALLLVYLGLSLRTAALLQVAMVEEKAGRADPRGRWPLAGRAALAAGAMSVAIMVGVFVVLPRNMIAAPPALAGQAEAMMNVSGFDSEIDLSRAGQIEESFEPVLEAEVLESGPLAKTSDRLYLRGAVLDEYEEGLQRAASTREREPIPLTRNRAQLLELPYGPERRIRVTFLRDNPPERLFTTELTHAVRILDGAPTLVGDPRTGEVLVDRGEVRSYLLESSPMARVEPSTEPLPPAFREGPVREMAMELLDSVGIERDPSERHTDQDERIVRFFERYLRTNYAYTTRPAPVAAGVDPIASFLREDRSGHCERFATGLAALARATGIEARVVTGYLTTERLSETVWVAREAHAHAWVEAHVEPGLWLLFDASPPGGVAEAHRRPTGPLAAARRGWEWVNDLWIRHVISYDRSSQSRLLGQNYDDAVASATRKPPTLESIGGLRGVIRSFAIGAGAFALTLLIGRLVPIASAWRRGRREARTAGGLPRIIRRADRLLQRVGLARDSSVPLRVHAERLRAAGAAVAEPYDELAALHYRLRFAGETADRDEVAQRADELIARLRAAARGGGP